MRSGEANNRIYRQQPHYPPEFIEALLREARQSGQTIRFAETDVRTNVDSVLTQNQGETEKAA